MQPDRKVDEEDKIPARDAERLRAEAGRVGNTDSRIRRPDRSKLGRAEGKIPRDPEAK